MLSLFIGKMSCVIPRPSWATSRTRRQLGTHYEKTALKFLRQRGLQLVQQNYRSRFGEIDLVMRENCCIVFVEVRFRSRNRFANARLTVDHRKQSRLVNTAAVFLSQHPQHADDTVRFDVLAFDRADDAPTTIQWIKDAFRP